MMERLKRKLQELGVTYADVGREAGEPGANVSQYFSRRQLGPVPWVEEALRRLLVRKGVATSEVEDLIGGWKADRMQLHKGDETMTETTATIEQQVAAAVEKAWGLPAQINASIDAMRQALTNGARVDDREIERTSKAQTQSLLAERLVDELERSLWTGRTRELGERKEALREQLAATRGQADALELAIAGVGETALLVECRELGVDPSEKLKALRGHATEKVRRELEDVTRALESLHKQPLYPDDGREVTGELRFARSLQEAAAALRAPWDLAATMPEAALALFRMREQIHSAGDLERFLREKALENGFSLDGLSYHLKSEWKAEWSGDRWGDSYLTIILTMKGIATVWPEGAKQPYTGPREQVLLECRTSRKRERAK